MPYHETAPAAGQVRSTERLSRTRTLGIEPSQPRCCLAQYCDIRMVISSGILQPPHVIFSWFSLTPFMVTPLASGHPLQDRCR